MKYTGLTPVICLMIIEDKNFSKIFSHLAHGLIFTALNKIILEICNQDGSHALGPRAILTAYVRTNVTAPSMEMLMIPIGQTKYKVPGCVISLSLYVNIYHKL